MHLWLSVVVREFGIDIKTLLYLKWITNKDLLYSSSILLNVMCQLGWEGNLGIYGYRYMYGWVPLLFT